MTAQIKTYKGFQLTRNSLGRWCGVYVDPITGVRDAPTGNWETLRDALRAIDLVWAVE